MKSLLVTSRSLILATVLIALAVVSSSSRADEAAQFERWKATHHQAAVLFSRWNHAPANLRADTDLRKAVSDLEEAISIAKAYEGRERVVMLLRSEVRLMHVLAGPKSFGIGSSVEQDAAVKQAHDHCIAALELSRELVRAFPESPEAAKAIQECTAWLQFNGFEAESKQCKAVAESVSDGGTGQNLGPQLPPDYGPGWL